MEHFNNKKEGDCAKSLEWLEVGRLNEGGALNAHSSERGTAVDDINDIFAATSANMNQAE